MNLGRGLKEIKMFAEMSPKCKKVMFGNVRSSPGSSVGPVGGKYKKIKHAPAPKVKAKKPPRGRNAGAEE